MRDQTGTFDYTRKVIHDLHKKALEAVEERGGNPLLVAILMKLVAK